jgi:hypothetical protein
MLRMSVAMPTFLLWLTTVLLPATALGRSITVDPSVDWCNTINTASLGDEIVFQPGSYTTPCWITARGTAASWITVRSQSEVDGQRATFAYPGSTANVLELRNAAYVILRGFAFAPTQDAVDAIRIRQVNDIIIERNIFTGIGGVSIPANDSGTTIPRLTIRQNVFRNLQSTGIYLGCHEGNCKVTDALVEGNFIDGVTSSGVGYGLEIKLNSYGTVRDNTIYRTKGPGLMAYGSNQGDPPTIFEGNYVEGSRTDGGIVIGGGPAVVRNNVLVGNAYGGISAQNYASRNLQRNIWIVHNTALNNADSGINVQGWTTGANNVIAYNALIPASGSPALRPSTPVGSIVGNVTCATPTSCFVNASTVPYDLWPTPTSPLLDSAGNGFEPWRPEDDFMGVSRGGSADVGAFERVASSIDHLVGGGNPRPPRVSSDILPPAAPSNLRAQ